MNHKGAARMVRSSSAGAKGARRSFASACRKRLFAALVGFAVLFPLQAPEAVPLGDLMQELETFVVDDKAFTCCTVSQTSHDVSGIEVIPVSTALGQGLTFGGIQIPALPEVGDIFRVELRFIVAVSNPAFLISELAVEVLGPVTGDVTLGVSAALFEEPPGNAAATASVIFPLASVDVGQVLPAPASESGLFLGFDVFGPSPAAFVPGISVFVSQTAVPEPPVVVLLTLSLGVVLGCTIGPARTRRIIAMMVSDKGNGGR